MDNIECGGGVMVAAVQPWSTTAANGPTFTGYQQIAFSPTGVVGCHGDRWFPVATSPGVSAVEPGMGAGNGVFLTSPFQNGLQAAITMGRLVAATPAVPPSAYVPQVRQQMMGLSYSRCRH